MQGKSWGDNGYGKIARNKDNHCGIAMDAMYPIVKEDLSLLVNWTKITTKLRE